MAEEVIDEAARRKIDIHMLGRFVPELSLDQE